MDDVGRETESFALLTHALYECVGGVGAVGDDDDWDQVAEHQETAT